MLNLSRVLASIASRIALAAFVAACGGGPGGPEGSSSGNQVADTTPPAVVSKLPTNDQEDVDRASAIVVTFSEPLNPSTVTSVNVLLRRAGVGDVQREIRWEAASRTVYIKPKTLLELDIQYKVTLTRGLKDAAGNELPQQEEWIFTTGPTIDYDPPVWRCSAVVTAEPLRFDTVEVSWAGRDPTLCEPGSTEAATPATDNVTPPEWLTYIVSYKLSSETETGFSTATSLPGASSLKVTGLQPKHAYEFKVQVRDLAEYLSDFRSLDGSIPMPPAGRLYAANFLANAVSSIPDIGTVNGNQAGTQVFSANETGLSTPIGVAVNAGSVTLQDATSCAPSDPPCQAPSMLYVSSYSANSITAYENPETLGEYPNRINAKPAWTLRGVETSLAEPAALWVDTETDANNVIVQEILYVANMRGRGPTFLGEQPVGNILAFDVTRTVANPTGAPQDPAGNSPPFGKIKSEWFRTPMSFAVDKAGHRLYVANRDKKYDSTVAGDQQGDVILAFPIPASGLDSLMNDSVPAPYFIQGSCSVPECALLGPTGIALDTDNDRLYVANRGQNNLVVIENASQANAALHTTRVIEGPSAKLVIDHPTSSQYNASPNAVFFDPVTRRLFATTRNAQSVLIFDVSDAVMNPATPTTPIVEGQIDLTPIRVIRGSRTGLGQPSGSAQSAGPFGLTVVNGEAYVASYGLHAIPIFDVSSSMDGFNTSTNTWNTPPNTPPIRLLMTPMQGLTGAALDRVSDPLNDRLYVAVFHSNLILVYNKVSTLTGSHLLPDRIIGGPATLLDHPVHLVFSPATADRTAALFVANQSGHSVSVFGGEPLPGETARDVGTLNGNVAPSRVLGPPDGTDPFAPDDPLSSRCTDPSTPPQGVNCTELAFPTGIALDEASGVLYVSNRDATAFEDFAGRKILAFANAFSVNVGDNVPPTWKIEGDPPPPPSYNMVLPPTDKTTLKRPAALFYDPAWDRLYVANRGNRTVLVFGNIPDPDPNRGPAGITETVLKSPPLTDYNVPPAWTIKNANLFAPTGFTGYIPPGQSLLSELYVADAGTSAILAFKVDALDPDVPSPTLTPRIIRGTSLGLNQPFGLALDPEK